MYTITLYIFYIIYLGIVLCTYSPNVTFLYYGFMCLENEAQYCVM